MHLEARVSSAAIPGTWGFGLWNDPYGFSFGPGNGFVRLPALPNAAWFFIASAPNYLSLRDDLPAQGGLAATFQSPHWPAALLAFGALALPLLALPPVARVMRRLGSGLTVSQIAGELALSPKTVSTYRARILEKMSVASNADLVRYAARHGLIP